MEYTNAMTSVAITGASGFIGANLALDLHRNGMTVIPIDLPQEKLSPLARARSEHLAGRGLDILQLDLRDFEHTASRIRALSFDIMIHLAGLPGVRSSFEKPLNYLETNLASSVNLAIAADSSGCEHFLYASSSSVYGEGRESLNEQAASIDRPVSPYAASKASLEIVLRSLRPNLNFTSLTALRFFTVFGKWGRPDMAVWRFTKALLSGSPLFINGDGSIQRDFTPIEDLTNKLAKLIEVATASKETLPEWIDLGNGESTSLNELIEKLASQFKVIPEVVLGPRSLGDAAWTKSEVGSQSKLGLLSLNAATSLDMGIEHWAQWAIENRDLVIAY